MEKLQIKTKGKTYVINIADILYCQASGAYTNVVLIDGRVVMASANLSKLHSKIDFYTGMFRVSQSILVNMMHIVCIHHHDKRLELIEQISVSFTVTIKEIEDRLEYLIGRVG